MMPPVELLRRLVELESPTGDRERIARIGRFLAAELEALGARVRFEGEALVGRIGEGDGGLLLAAHMDTVWPAGTLTRMPFRVEDGHAWGPGALDMKAGIVTGVEALRRSRALARPITFLVTADEEIGSPRGRAVVEALAEPADAVLVLEPPVRDGTITTARSGLARYQMRITGRAAHAGNGSRAGVSAVEELAHQTLALHELPRRVEGARVNVGQVGGGTGDNVVAGEAWARIDARAWTSEAQARLERAIRGLEPRLEGAAIEIAGGITRPPMIPTPEAAAVAERAIGIAHRLGIRLDQHTSAGGSDGNFAAAVGACVLDGLGPTGVGAHATDERVSLESLAERVALLGALLAELVPARAA
jgi:glutamate carboxypeptidase